MFDTEDFLAKLKEIPGTWKLASFAGRPDFIRHETGLCPLRVLAQHRSGTSPSTWLACGRALGFAFEDSRIVVLAADNSAATFMPGFITKTELAQANALRQRMIEVLHPEEV